MHPKIKELLEIANSMPAISWEDFTPEDAKKSAILRAESAKISNFDLEQVFEMTDHKVKHIPIRIYKPSADPNLPIVIYFHGGGLMTGSIAGYDANCCYIVNRSNTIIISVDYRLTPEHKFPCAIEDAYEVVCWANQNAQKIGGNSEKISVMGDSSGAYLAIVATLMAKDKGFPKIYSQILLYPHTDANCNTESYQTHGQGFSLTANMMKWYFSHYQNTEEDLQNPYFSPLLAKNLANLPKALILTAELDPLRDDGFLYAEKLKKFGVPVEYICYESMIHGFFKMPKWLESCRNMVAKIIDFLQR